MECLDKEGPELKSKGLVRVNHTKGEVRVHIKEAVRQELGGKTCGRTLRNLARMCYARWGWVGRARAW